MSAPAPVRSGRFRPLPPLAVLALAAALPLAPPAAAQPRPPFAGGYGFDWLQPGCARCREITPSVLRSFSGCRLAPNAFGAGIDAQACRLLPWSEYVIYPSRADCEKGLGAMKANAP